jgi:hypothetical protein
MRALAFFVATAACGGGGPESQTAQQTSVEDAVVERLIVDSQRAGFERHDLEAYLAPWADDGLIVIGRGPEASPHDHAITRAQNEAIKRLRFAGRPPRGARMSHAEARVEVDGDQAVMTVQTSFRSEGVVEVVRERYTLARRAGRWQITENRWWLEAAGFGDESIAYDAERWAELDAAVESARESGDRERLAFALAAASRHAEALALWKEITVEPDASGRAWSARALSALLSGDADDALASFHRAREHGEPIPDYAEARLSSP